VQLAPICRLNHKHGQKPIHPSPPQQHRHLTQRALDAGESARFSGIFHASAFFWLDGFAVPVPAQVTPAVRRQHNERKPDGYLV
jgi:hypothetical protein